MKHTEQERRVIKATEALVAEYSELYWQAREMVLDSDRRALEVLGKVRKTAVMRADVRSAINTYSRRPKRVRGRLRARRR